MKWQLDFEMQYKFISNKTFKKSFSSLGVRKNAITRDNDHETQNDCNNSVAKQASVFVQATKK